MAPTLLAFNHAESSKRERRLRDRVSDAYKATITELVDRGAADAKTLLSSLVYAYEKLEAHLESRTRAAEQKVNRLLALELPSDLERLIFDAAHVTPYPRILDTERELLALYRELPQDAKQAIRTLCRRLTSSVEQENPL
jgi:hypothetical protein